MVTLPEDLAGRVMDRVRQMVCGLHGHDSLLQFERDRMYLRCASCGHETPGWELNDETPHVVARTAAARDAAAKPLVRPASQTPGHAATAAALGGAAPQLIRVRRVA